MAPRRPVSIRSSASSVASLVGAAKRGNESAFATLHHRYCGMVHATLLVRVGVGDADDLAQDTFVTAWQRIGDLRDEEAFGGWIQSIARRKAASLLRSRRPTVHLPGTLAAPRRLTAEATEALEALRSLPPHLAEPLAMRLIKGMSGPEIAATTGLTHGSVRVTLHRAMKRLREILEVSDDRA